MPTLEEEDGFLLWESNSVVRYLAAKHDKDGALQPKDLAARPRQPMDGLAVVGRRSGITPAFWGLIRTPEDKRDMAAIKASQDKTVAAMQIMDAQLAKTKFLAGDRSPMATFRSASCATATGNWCPAGPRRRTSTAGTTRFHRARRSRIMSAVFR